MTSITNNVSSCIADRRSSVRVSRKSSSKHGQLTMRYLQIGHAEVSGSINSNGQASLEASVSESKETNNGNYSAEIKGGVYQDTQGNTSAEVRASMSVNW